MRKLLQERFEDLFRVLARHDRVEVIAQSHDFDPYDQETIRSLVRMLDEHYGYRVPEQLQEVVNFPMEISLFWKYKGYDDPERLGEFRLENILNAISLEKNQVPINNEDLDAETLALMRRARYFDTLPHKDWNTATVLVLDEATDFPSLWLLDDLKMFPLDLDLADYFEALFLTKGMYYWQYLFCDKSAYGTASNYKKDYIAMMMDSLERLFPEEDYTTLKNRFKRLSF